MLNRVLFFKIASISSGRMFSETGDEPALPGCLNGTWRVVLPDVGDCLVVRYSIKYSETGQSSAGASVAASTGDFDTFEFSACPSLE
ncbi:hypothetical protein J2TS4_08390 [Paenibacillus sp. J2TS4]|nr:hypothetical protein J2TS4_08390 [Paenibacillus sp. J2TS4]